MGSGRGKLSKRIRAVCEQNDIVGIDETHWRFALVVLAEFRDLAADERNRWQEQLDSGATKEFVSYLTGQRDYWGKVESAFVWAVNIFQQQRNP